MPTLRDQSGLGDPEIAFDELACDQLNFGVVASSASDFRIARQQWSIQGFGKDTIHGVVGGQRVADASMTINGYRAPCGRGR